MLETDDWIYKTPPHSSIETKLWELLLNLGRKEQILGVQVCVSLHMSVKFLNRN